jgi:hypothetical protein
VRRANSSRDRRVSTWPGEVSDVAVGVGMLTVTLAPFALPFRRDGIGACDDRSTSAKRSAGDREVGNALARPRGERRGPSAVRHLTTGQLPSLTLGKPE